MSTRMGTHFFEVMQNRRLWSFLLERKGSGGQKIMSHVVAVKCSINKSRFDCPALVTTHLVWKVSVKCHDTIPL